MPVSTSGLIPTVALTSEIVIVPSSTRTPFGSLTVKSFASAKRLAFALTVIAVGATQRPDQPGGPQGAQQHALATPARTVGNPGAANAVGEQRRAQSKRAAPDD